MSSYSPTAADRSVPWLGLLVTLFVAGFVAVQMHLADVRAPFSPSHAPAQRAAHHASHKPAWLTQAERLNVRYACSHTGLAEGVIPTHAVVKVGRQVRLTSFDEGWAIHLDQAPGTLLSVCAR